jgi:GDP-L-fucose synthase
MSKNIIVTGGSGSLGKALQKNMMDNVDVYFPSRIHHNLLFISHINNMLRSIDSEKIDTIIHAAALVGGINDNINRPEDYFYENVVMNSNLIRASVKYNVKRFIGILSTCAYPDVASRYPMTEDMLHEGPPAPTNFAYGYAKRAMAVHIDACNKQYGTKYNYLIPCNLYGGIIPEDPDRAHFLDTLLLKINKAKKSGATHIDLMGTGKARRQYMLTDDFAQVIKMVIDRDITESFNVCPDENPTIAEVVDIALQVCDAKDIQVRWDPSKPDGQLNKQASNKKMKSLLPDFTFTSLEEGIRKAYKKIG